MRQIRLLLIEKSIFFLDTCAQELLKRLPAGSLVEKADNPVDAISKIRIFQPDIILMNFSLGLITVDGCQFLPALTSQQPEIPVIVYGLMATSRNTAIKMGAHDYLKKPSVPQSLPAFFDEISQMVIQAVPPAPNENQVSDVGPSAMVTREIWHATMPEKDKTPVPPATDFPAADVPPADTSIADVLNQLAEVSPVTKIDLIAIGSSTGGTEALSYILPRLRPPLPGILIVQHIPPMFSRLLAQRLDSECRLTIKEAASGDIVKPDHVYIAPGSKHMTVYRHGNRLLLDCRPGPPVHSCCPSVDVLFKSVAREVGSHALGVILTGMGRDGAAGLLEMHQQGSPTLGQDKASCVVYGMPKSAYELGAVDRQISLNDMPAAISKMAQR